MSFNSEIEPYQFGIEQEIYYRNKEDKKLKKKKEINEDVEEMAQALFIYWKSKELMRSKDIQYEEANEKAELLWKDKIDDGTLELFRKAAAVQIVMLGGEFIAQKKKKIQKCSFERNRAECNPFLLFCKDHKENVREKGSRGKGMTTLSNMWKELPDSEKEKYLEIAKQNKSKERRCLNKDIQEQDNLAVPSIQSIPSVHEYQQLTSLDSLNPVTQINSMSPLTSLNPINGTINIPFVPPSMNSPFVHDM
ncbi:hypothetical protein EHI8A_002360 [Entamoeba histolytica HM-1:IMSS-B]|uniref:HMG box domain-containing protein n=6 Tax=Entamoeba histolytica TaxID=5759 RepID=C4M0Y7_ENTH1|nr:hypothetical protein EHI_135000 [Entamoeba histolytica HM-1:IMSS]EMD48598.1 high mobility group (HMG) box domain containing protein [Entamoeba histolytica KU27]EMH76437.1 hypothetical protein EHI8A_002360 [Entamoeba histolytica HM-1:IMSS-B]EMS14490.1 high mobility group (HMG) box domain containing protein [Entamoeba histolytica HM-3:IMSS]GAT94844.1 hypothetical protein CL6EHI_135000 [Entamoeba histolytica]EAL46279.1 hypothetical protein EHI_135000 [Entamoeba histolytica HM-1:IMSS]|eukprot:XP_651666.1 hypothetical protein EHI_135000 [Entamoeba histolytica HM-1:IMSS]